MATTIMVDTAAIDSAINKITGFRQEYQEAYGELYKIDSRINETWQGVDSNKFSEQLQGFRDDFDDLNGKFGDYLDFLNNAKQTYETTQSNITKDAARLAVDR